MGSVVEINPFTRVEGHGSVKLYLDGARAERVELCLTESPRLFEALLVGRSFAEVPEIICRICSLCSTVHKVAALRAVERAFGTTVSPVTGLTRELILLGGLIQSHALHLYCLLLPDLLELAGVAELAAQAPELLKRGLAIKQAGNLVQETVGGRLIHPVNIRLGGLGQRVGRDSLLRMRDALEAILPACREALHIFRTPFPFPQLGGADFLALEPQGNPVGGERLRMSGGRSFPLAAYREQVVESVLPHSHAKHALVMGVEPTVGSLARLNLAKWPVTGSAGELGIDREEIVGQDMRANNLAQAIELCRSVERSLELIEELLTIGRDGEGNREVKPVRGSGSAAYEAPRGVLIHSYGFDDAGVCTEADVVTPTSLNQGALSRDLLALARGMEGAGESELAGALERLVRCYDPCISCSVHLVRL